MGLKVLFDDITKLTVDAVVNSTNPNLVGYSGVDRIIHELGRDELDEACARLSGKLVLGEAVSTKAYNMPCKYIIHIASLYWQGGYYGESAIQRSCYRKALEEAEKLKCKSVAFPLIAAGNNLLPVPVALENAVTVISEYLSLYSDMDVYLVLHGDVVKTIYDAKIDELDKYIEGEFKPEEGRIEPLEDAINNTGEAFIDMLIRLMNERDMTEVQVYKAAGIQKGTFNKIMNGGTKKPSIETLAAIAMAMKLSYEETINLLASCGMAFSASSKFDIIVSWFIKAGNYNIWELDQQLFKYGYKTLLGTE